MKSKKIWYIRMNFEGICAFLLIKMQHLFNKSIQSQVILHVFF